MKKYFVIHLIFISWLSVPVLSQTSFSKIGEPFVLDTKHPQLELINPDGGIYFINDSILVEWGAFDESFGNEPISVGLSITESVGFTLLKENISNTGSVYIQTGPDLSQYGKVNILAKDTFGLVTEKMSTDFFELIVGYTQLTFSPSHADFGAVPVNSVSDTSLLVWIINKGNKNLNIESPGSINEPFGFDFTTPSTIPPGDSLEFEITMNLSFPPGIYADTIVFDTTSKTINQLPVSAILYASLPEVAMGDDITKCAISTITLTANATGGVPPYTYAWNTGATTPHISTSTEVDSTFIITITDQLGLQDSDTLEVFIQQVFQGEEICIVTVDSASQKNIVVWEKTPGMGTDYYNIYRYEVGYQLIGSVPYEDLSVFIDYTSIPNSYNYLYKLSSVDSCGNESALSDHHQTIRLTTSVGVPSGVTLNWNPYVGFDYYKFYIYRGSSYDNLQLIDSVNNFTLTHNDPNPPPLEMFYRIMVAKQTNEICHPSLDKAATGEFKQSISNIGDGGQSIQLRFRVFLEGAFHEGFMQSNLYQADLLPRVQPFNQFPWYYTGNEQVDEIPDASIIDWVLIELRGVYSLEPEPSLATPATSILKIPAFLRSDGFLIDLDGFNYPSVSAILPSESFALYAVIWHRNHLSVLTNYPLTLSAGNFNYNFWTNPNRVYGGLAGHKLLVAINDTTYYGMIAGDANSDGVIDMIDKDSVWSNFAGESGYIHVDFNLDGNINNMDKNNFWFPNLGKGSQVPTGSAPTN